MTRKVSNTLWNDVLYWSLRIGCAWEFIGHGAFGIRQKVAWLPYMQVWGISESLGLKLMPVIGFMDIALGMLVLFSPRRFALAYMAFWGFFTACLRPLVGEPIWELIERSYNYGVPLIFLILHKRNATNLGWFLPLKKSDFNNPVSKAGGIEFILRAILCFYFLGHGALGVFIQKKQLILQYQSLGLDGKSWILLLGYLDIACGVFSLISRNFVAIGLLMSWKITSEFLFVLTSTDPQIAIGLWAGIWEFIERGGAYATPLALLALMRIQRQIKRFKDLPFPSDHSNQAFTV